MLITCFFAPLVEDIMKDAIICARLKNLLAFTVITTSWLPPKEQTSSTGRVCNLCQEHNWHCNALGWFLRNEVTQKCSFSSFTTVFIEAQGCLLPNISRFFFHFPLSQLLTHLCWVHTTTISWNPYSSPWLTPWLCLSHIYCALKSPLIIWFSLCGSSVITRGSKPTKSNQHFFYTHFWMNTSTL